MSVAAPVIGRGGLGRGLRCRLGTPDWGPIRGRGTNLNFWGIWGVWIWLQSQARHKNSRGYQRGPQKSLCDRLCSGKKHLWVQIIQNMLRAAPAYFEMSQITATSPHQRGRGRKKQTTVQVVHIVLGFPKGLTFIRTLSTRTAAANSS